MQHALQSVVLFHLLSTCYIVSVLNYNSTNELRWLMPTSLKITKCLGNVKQKKKKKSSKNLTTSHKIKSTKETWRV